MTDTTTARGDWLTVSMEGFAQLQRARPLTQLVKELVQNALDATAGAGTVTLCLWPSQDGLRITCDDDGCGMADLEKLSVMCHTTKKYAPANRGRIGRGFKDVLALASTATVESRGRRLAFSHGPGGRTSAIGPCDAAGPGFRVDMTVRHPDEASDLAPYFDRMLVGAGTALVVNGRLVAHRPPRHVVRASLATETFAGSAWLRDLRETTVSLVPVAAGEAPSIHEMGIPVCRMDWPEGFHVDVGQRIPMRPSRDTVAAGYPEALRQACLPAIVGAMTPERAMAPWVAEAATALAAPSVARAVVRRAYGGRVAVSSVPADGRFDYDAEAEEAGMTVLHERHLAPAMRSLVRAASPTTREVAERARDDALELACALSLSAEAIERIPAGRLARPDSEAVAAIARHGARRVADRLRFAGWLAGAIIGSLDGTPAGVLATAAMLPGGTAAAWSEDDVLTLSLGRPETWAAGMDSGLMAILVHETAHHWSMHHGRGFPRQVERCAGAGMAIMMRTPASDLERDYPTLLK